MVMTAAERCWVSIEGNTTKREIITRILLPSWYTVKAKLRALRAPTVKSWFCYTVDWRRRKAVNIEFLTVRTQRHAAHFWLPTSSGTANSLSEWHVVVTIFCQSYLRESEIFIRSSHASIYTRTAFSEYPINCVRHIKFQFSPCCETKRSQEQACPKLYHRCVMPSRLL